MISDDSVLESNVETVDLNFVFGTQISLDKFKESFLNVEISGFILREVADFYYLDICQSEIIGESRWNEESGLGNRRKLRRPSRHQQLSPVKEATTPLQVDQNSQIFRL